MIKSEFDQYLNMTYIILDHITGTGFCLDNQRYLEGRKFSKAIDDVEKLIDASEQQSSEAILSGEISILPKIEKIDDSLSGLIAKMDLYAIQYKGN